MMMTNLTVQGFDDAFGLLIGNEGGYSNNPADPGGETMWGITQRVAVSWGYTGQMRELPQATAKLIAKALYWDKYQCDQLPPLLGYFVFDAAFNGGHPVQWLQQAVGVAVDGVMGAETVAAARSCNLGVAALRYCATHLQYYVQLHNGAFLGGWDNRVASNMLVAAANLQQ
jgi:lysozyme family protein